MIGGTIYLTWVPVVQSPYQREANRGDRTAWESKVHILQSSAMHAVRRTSS